MEIIGTRLFFGASNSPTTQDYGVVFSVLADGSDLRVEYAVSEQGIWDMQAYGDELFIPGADTVEDTWLKGSVYHMNSDGNWSRSFTVPMAIHVTGLWCGDGELYVSIVAWTGNGNEARGRVLVSTDNGDSWSVVGSDISLFSCYDIIKFGGRLYSSSTEPGILRLVFYSEGSWHNTDVDCAFARMLVFGSYLVGGVRNTSSIFAVNADNEIAIYDTGHTLSTMPNIFTVIGEYLYMLAENGSVYRSNNLSDWVYFCHINNAISIGKFPDNALAVADKGLNATIWKVTTI